RHTRSDRDWSSDVCSSDLSIHDRAGVNQRLDHGWRSGRMDQNSERLSLGRRWSDARPTKTLVFWCCVASAVLTMIIGFSWGGWRSEERRVGKEYSGWWWAG